MFKMIPHVQVRAVSSHQVALMLPDLCCHVVTRDAATCGRGVATVPVCAPLQTAVMC